MEKYGKTAVKPSSVRRDVFCGGFSVSRKYHVCLFRGVG